MNSSLITLNPRQSTSLHEEGCSPLHRVTKLALGHLGRTYYLHLDCRSREVDEYHPRPRCPR